MAKKKAKPAANATSAKKSVKKAAKKTVKKTPPKAAKKSAAKKATAKKKAAPKAARPKTAAKKPSAAAAAASPKAPRKVAKKVAPAGMPKPATSSGVTPGVGTLAPDFTLADGAGRTHSLSQYRGSPVVLYFYPKDDTPGCTTEACGFRDAHHTYTVKNVVVLGVSPDSSASHQRFSEKFNLPFTLLADEDHKVAEAYGVWREKSMYGRKYMGVARVTFLIDKDGRIQRVFDPVKPDGHEREVLAAL